MRFLLMKFTYPSGLCPRQIPIFHKLLVILQSMLLWFLDTAFDDREEHFRLGFIEVRIQSKFGKLEIQTGKKWVPWFLWCGSIQSRRWLSSSEPVLVFKGLLTPNFFLKP